MQKVTDTKIELTRGDTFKAQVVMVKYGEEYTPQDGDTIRFALKRPNMDGMRSEYSDENPLIEKVIPNDTLILRLEPSDTKPLGFGEYVYDIEITFADGDVDTFINNAQFVLVPEVL